jgi:hypothetical protein
MRLAKYLYIGAVHMVGLGDLKGPNQVGNVLPLRMGSKNESGALEIEMEVWRFVKGRLARYKDYYTLVSDR